MPIAELNHFFVRAKNLERSRAFYCDALGFEVMPRPDLPFPGYWLGVNGNIQVHMGLDGIAEAPAYYLGTSPASARDNSGVIDHIAFLANDIDGMACRLARLKIPTRVNYISAIRLFQVFVTDPDGLTIELNFPGIEAAPAWPGTSDAESQEGGVHPV